jgi:virulence-associated protein VapD
MLDAAVTKLNFTIKLDSLKEYYHTLVKNYDHLKWSWNKHGLEITDEWRERMMQDRGTLLPYGWAIQSNLVDINIPCPPYNISTHPRTTYRNTELAFGLVTKLQELIPYSYRWSLVVQPPGGKVARHVDQGDEYTVHIPIYEASNAIFKFWDDVENRKDFTMQADGSVYLVDTIIAHETENYDATDRIGLVFRFNRSDLSKLIKLTGEIS